MYLMLLSFHLAHQSVIHDDPLALQLRFARSLNQWATMIREVMDVRYID
jgi:hypothetical protein